MRMGRSALNTRILSDGGRGNNLVVPLGSVALVGLLLIFWQLSSEMTFIIPAPSETFAALFENLRDPGYLLHARETTKNIAGGFVIGVSLGAALGIVLGSIPWMRRLFEPLIVALNSVPKIIIYPLLLPIFQIGAASKIAMGAIHALFPMLIMVTGAVRQMPPVYRRLGRSLQLSRFQTLRYIILPSIRRSFLTGLRLGVSLATIGVVLAEFFSTILGLGREMNQAYQFGQHATLMSTVLLLLGVSFLLSFAIWMVERRLPE